jgi:type IV pilus assembly protein PilX
MRAAQTSFSSRLTHNRQSGFALAMTLIMLLILTILGVTAVSMSTLQQKMAANMQDVQVALNAADSALRDAEAWIVTQEPKRPVPLGGTAACTTTTTVCALGIGDTIATQDDAWWTTNAREFGASGTKEIVKPTSGSRDPRYVIEDWHFEAIDISSCGYGKPCSGYAHFRITAHGWGDTPSAKALIATKFSKYYLDGNL